MDLLGLSGAWVDDLGGSYWEILGWIPSNATASWILFWSKLSPAIPNGRSLSLAPLCLPRWTPFSTQRSRWYLAEPGSVGQGHWQQLKAERMPREPNSHRILPAWVCQPVLRRCLPWLWPLGSCWPWWAAQPQRAELSVSHPWKAGRKTADRTWDPSDLPQSVPACWLHLLHLLRAFLYHKFFRGKKS